MSPSNTKLPPEIDKSCVTVFGFAYGEKSLIFGVPLLFSTDNAGLELSKNLLLFVEIYFHYQ